MSLPIKHSVAVLIRDDSRILVLRRPDTDDELPGVWGLPAGSYRPSETLEDLIARIGRDKLGVDLKPVRRLVSGSQDRPAYRLEMELWEAQAGALPGRGEWKWSSAEILKSGRDQGSLCCELALRMEEKLLSNEEAAQP